MPHFLSAVFDDVGHYKLWDALLTEFTTLPYNDDRFSTYYYKKLKDTLFQKILTEHQNHPQIIGASSFACLFAQQVNPTSPRNMCEFCPLQFPQNRRSCAMLVSPIAMSLALIQVANYAEHDFQERRYEILDRMQTIRDLPIKEGILTRSSLNQIIRSAL